MKSQGDYSLASTVLEKNIGRRLMKSRMVTRGYGTGHTISRVTISLVISVIGWELQTEVMMALSYSSRSKSCDNRLVFSTARYYTSVSDICVFCFGSNCSRKSCHFSET